MKRTLLALLLLPLGCAEKATPPARTVVEVVMTTERQGEECLLTLGEQSFLTKRLDSAALLQRLRNLKGRPILLRFDNDAPYRCVGAAIFMLQRARAAFRAPQIPTE